MSEMNKPNVGVSLVVVHAIISRAIEAALANSRGFAGGGFPDAAVRDGFADYVHCLVSVTHSHHLTEDEIAFPYFRELVPEMPYELLEEDHRHMTEMLDEIQPIPGRMKADDDPGQTMNQLAAVLSRLSAMWQPHITIEEGHFTAEAANRLLTDAQQLELIQRFARHGQEHTDPDYLVVPFQLYNLPPEQRAMLAGGMPPVVTQELVPVVWKDKWAPMKPFLLD